MLLEIRNIVQRSLERRKRWFHDDDFDLYVWQAPCGEVLELQLCQSRSPDSSAMPSATTPSSTALV